MKVLIMMPGALAFVDFCEGLADDEGIEAEGVL